MKIIVTAMMTMAVTSAIAAWRVVADPWTTAQVTANASSQKLIEEQHNARLDSMSAKQQKIMQYTAAMETIKELYRISMQNISGFGEESKYYGEICQVTLEIMTDVPAVLEYIAKSPVRNYVLCLNEMSNVVSEAEGLVADFTCRKCGGELKTIDTGNKDIPHVYVCQKCGWNTNCNVVEGENDGDGYNFLDRYERLTLANRVYSRLLEIKYKMEVMCMMCQYCNGINEVLMAIDVQSWAAFFTGKNIVEGIINDWNALGV